MAAMQMYLTTLSPAVSEEPAIQTPSIAPPSPPQRLPPPPPPLSSQQQQQQQQQQQTSEVTGDVEKFDFNLNREQPEPEPAASTPITVIEAAPARASTFVSASTSASAAASASAFVSPSPSPSLSPSPSATSKVPGNKNSQFQSQSQSQSHTDDTGNRSRHTSDSTPDTRNGTNLNTNTITTPSTLTSTTTTTGSTGSTVTTTLPPQPLQPPPPPPPTSFNYNPVSSFCTTPSYSAPTTTTTTTTAHTITAPTTTSTSSSTSASIHNTQLHSHRQTNNSSKLPTFRFADLKRESLTLPSLLRTNNQNNTQTSQSNQNNQSNVPKNHPSHTQIPPSPVSPDPDQLQFPQHQPQPQSLSVDQSASIEHNNSSAPAPAPAPSRASTFQPSATATRTSIRTSTSTVVALPSERTTTTTTSSGSANVKRSVSLDSSISSAAVDAVGSRTSESTSKLRTSRTSQTSSSTKPEPTIVVARPHHRRALVSRSSDHIGESTGHPQSLITQGISTPSGTQSAPASADLSKEWSQGQRELLLPKAVQQTNADDRRSSITTRRPPVSYKPPTNTHSSGGSTSIPPIRSFRSSLSRRSLNNLDMSSQSPRAYVVGRDPYGDSNHRDRTLRALEGRRNSAQHITPPHSATTQADFDDSGDVFLKIAREDASRRNTEHDAAYTDSQNAIARITRNSRRPFSTTIPSNQPSSPTQAVRRLSDQETSRTRGFSDDQGGRIARSLTQRSMSREQAPEELNRKTSAQLRPSPLAPRSVAPQDSPKEPSSPPVVNYSRRRQPSVDGSAMQSRMSSLKTPTVAYGNGRMFNSSPLAPRSAETQKHDSHHADPTHGPEGTDSTTSTAAPSTVWDELDDLKSRIHRLELTGKLPPTSGAAISRASEERPPTANTNATTMSASPKRGARSVTHQTANQDGDLTIVAHTQKESHPILHSALAKSKQFLSPDVYTALEAAANDALNLSSMMGTAGQPGPISSATSSVGGGPVVTDRQLRRKTDSICRSLTELCLALSEKAAQTNTQQATSLAPAPDKTPLTSPTVTKFTFTGFPEMKSINQSERPPIADRGLRLVTSPKTVSRLEQRRNSALLSASALPSPRFASSFTPSASVVASPTEGPTAGRKSSLLLSRTRRAHTEEPEEARKAPMLRTRRAGTEEPEESNERKPSLLIRGRRSTIDREDEDVSRLRASSRAVTEVNGTQTRNREYTSQVPLPPSTNEPMSPLASSALPKRRIPSGTMSSRLAQPSGSSGITARRLLERSTPDREGFSGTSDRGNDERDQRRHSLSQNPPVSRTSSTRRSNRQSMIAISSAATQSNGYR